MIVLAESRKVWANSLISENCSLQFFFACDAKWLDAMLFIGSQRSMAPFCWSFRKENYWVFFCLSNHATTNLTKSVMTPSGKSFRSSDLRQNFS